MRLDKWLKVSRLIKRRTVANEACDNERISANGRVVKASYEVKVGDQLEIRFGAGRCGWRFSPSPSPRARRMPCSSTKNFDFQRMGSCETRNPSRFLFLPAPKTPPWNMAPGRGCLVGGDY